MPLGDNSYIIQAYETISNINVELDIDIRVTAEFWNYSAEFLNPERKKNCQNYSVEIQDAYSKKVNRIALRMHSYALKG
ncbi:hypothetical protein [Candidatus Endomicrobiellum trichonymphae]|uniref:hypothetical protein n=1 Tax=Endomicrobium trichonymphae TaxID=1408204 RepID=UPI000BBB1823|nr:hypothetical protein [Candidatus Endomicrobium trichonymphae]